MELTQNNLHALIYRLLKKIYSSNKLFNFKYLSVGTFVAFIFGIVGLLVYISIYLFLLLLPYYIAYSLIDPSSFLGVIGVFVLGSVIVPLSLWVVFLTLGGFYAIFDKIKSSSEESVNTYINNPIKTITPLDSQSPKNTKRNVLIIAICSVIGISLVVLLANIQHNNTTAIDIDEESYASEVLTGADEIDVLDDTSAASESLFDMYGYSEINDDYLEMTRAVKNILSTINASGISGAAKLVRNCYVSSDIDKLYCVYLDNAARLLDKEVAREMGFQRNEYLTDERSQQRANQYFYTPTNSINLSREHAVKIEKELMNILSYEVKKLNSNSTLEETSTIANSVGDNTSTDMSTDLRQEVNQKFTRKAETPVEFDAESFMKDENLDQ